MRKGVLLSMIREYRLWAVPRFPRSVKCPVTFVSCFLFV